MCGTATVGYRRTARAGGRTAWEFVAPSSGPVRLQLSWLQESRDDPTQACAASAAVELPLAAAPTLARVGPGRLTGTVVTTEPLGSDLLAYVEIAAPPVVTEEILEVADDTDRAVAERLRAEASGGRTVAVARFGIDSRAQPGMPIEVGVQTSKLHFFDLDTEAAISS